MKRMISGLAIMIFIMAVLCPTVLASNGDDWLIIKKRHEAVPAATETEKEKNLKTIPFSKLYAEEDLRKKTTVPFKELYVESQQSDEKVVTTQAIGTASSVALSIQPGLFYTVESGDTVSRIFKRFCDKGHWKTISGDNGLDQNHTIYPDQKLLIRDELLKEEYKDPLMELSKANNKMKQLSERVSVLEKNALMLETMLVAEETKNNSLAQQVASLKDQLATVSGKNTSELKDAMSSLEEARDRADRFAEENSVISGKIDTLEKQLSEKDQAGETISGKLESPKSSRGLEKNLLFVITGICLVFLALGIVGTYVFMATGNKEAINRLAKEEKRNSDLHDIMRRERVSFKFDLPKGKREFSCYLERDGDQFDISPFSKSAGNDLVSLVDKKGTARDVVKGQVKRWLEGDTMPAVNEAIESGMLVEHEFV